MIMYDFEISAKELRAAAHNMPGALELEARIAALEEEVKSLRQQKRDYIETLVVNEEFIQGAKAAKLKLINEAVMRALEEMGPEGVLNALAVGKPMPKKAVLPVVKKAVEPLGDIPPVMSPTASVTIDMVADTSASIEGGIAPSEVTTEPKAEVTEAPLEQAKSTNSTGTHKGNAAVSNEAVKVTNAVAEYISELEFEDCNVVIESGEVDL